MRMVYGANKMTTITSDFMRVKRESSYYFCEVENGNNNNCIGDALWFSKDGTECEICDDILDRVEMSELSLIFDNESMLKIIKKFG